MIKRIDKLSDNLYTPDWLVNLIVDFYGGQIDLDPSADPQKRVPALKHYTFEDDGLNQEWEGKVFCNPPYSKSNVSSLQDWVTKGLESVKSDSSSATQVILLLPANTDTKWGQQVLVLAKLRLVPVLFIAGRIAFLDSDYSKTKSTGRFASILVNVGGDRKRFQKTFGHLGVIV